MMKGKTILAVSAAALASALCAENLDVKIDTSKTYQTIDNFAAADAWCGNLVGRYFDDAQKGQIAKWLFSQKLGADGNPEGIGLSLWRVNLGGGTAEQDGADISRFHYREEAFLTKDGRNYDWGKCAGQQYFMKKAKEYGCDKFLLFSNTPPVHWTRNGKGYGQPGDPKANIKPDCYGKFADYMADVAKHFQNGGYNIAYISPINEPQVNWDSNRQEGSTWECSQMKKVFVELDRAITQKGVNTKILIGETAAPAYNYAESRAGMPAHFKKSAPEERPNFIIKKFFDPKSRFYVGDLKNMPKFLAGHSYHSHNKNADMRKTNRLLRAEAEKYGIGFQQSEWCMLGYFTPKTHEGLTPDWYSDNKVDDQVALVMGRVICSDFIDSNALAWGYWKGMELKGDNALVGVYPFDGIFEKGGVARANKLLWALGNFSFFVRPEFKRIEMSGADNLDKTVGVAFVSPDGKRIVAVFVNSSFECDDAALSLPAGFKNARAGAFRTDRNSDLTNLRIDESARKIKLAPRSITTVVFDR